MAVTCLSRPLGHNRRTLGNLIKTLLCGEFFDFIRDSSSFAGEICDVNRSRKICCCAQPSVERKLFLVVNIIEPRQRMKSLICACDMTYEVSRDERRTLVYCYRGKTSWISISESSKSLNRLPYFIHHI